MPHCPNSDAQNTKAGIWKAVQNGPPQAATRRCPKEAMTGTLGHAGSQRPVLRDPTAMSPKGRFHFQPAKGPIPGFAPDIGGRANLFRTV
jgi:hypothetical protein